MLPDYTALSMKVAVYTPGEPGLSRKVLQIITMIDKNTKIYIAGHKGLVGSAIWRGLRRHGFYNLIGKSSNELDLRDRSETDLFLLHEQPEVIIDAAARLGGIWANREYPYFSWRTCKSRTT